ncbi:hypothetical protein [Escherichia coli]|uniref:hypothetical protein n=1 Tax=Escherichia coli TaxID=562 RepID=UPI0021806D6D|nr:hypothetical protein [Escherichia coli]MCS7439443.1 hypothetical protein [Escherichia coli]
MEKRLLRGLLPVPGLLLTCSFRPYPLILWITVLPFLCESVSEEAEKRLDVHFLLTHLCGISHPAWRTFHTIRTDAAWLSQYTLRYRYVTGSGLRPDTR